MGEAKVQKKASKKQSKLLHIITTPFRALSKARDFYVNSMLDCANQNAIGLQGTAQTVSLPRSFSSASSSRSYNDDDDYRELVRAASARDVEKGKVRTQRSMSVAMGRIDEERASNYFGEFVSNNNFVSNNRKNDHRKYPRSKSDVVGRTISF